jgi:hypothetical protein
MKKLYLGVALAAVFAVTGGIAEAKAPAGTVRTAAGAPATTTAPFTLAAPDATKLKDWITAQKTASVAPPAGFNVAVGTVVPMTIMLHPIPATVGVPAVGMHQYAVIGGKVVLVNPTDRKIVYVFTT